MITTWCLCFPSSPWSPVGMSRSNLPGVTFTGTSPTKVSSIWETSSTFPPRLCPLPCAARLALRPQGPGPRVSSLIWCCFLLYYRLIGVFSCRNVVLFLKCDNVQTTGIKKTVQTLLFKANISQSHICLTASLLFSFQSASNSFLELNQALIVNFWELTHRQTCSHEVLM